MGPKGESCGECYFWEDTTKNASAITQYGACRRNPPASNEGDFVFPYVVNGEWCGEFKQKELKVGDRITGISNGH